MLFISKIFASCKQTDITHFSYYWLQLTINGNYTQKLYKTLNKLAIFCIPLHYCFVYVGESVKRKWCTIINMHGKTIVNWCGKFKGTRSSALEIEKKKKQYSFRYYTWRLIKLMRISLNFNKGNLKTLTLSIYNKLTYNIFEKKRTVQERIYRTRTRSVPLVFIPLYSIIDCV